MARIRVDIVGGSLSGLCTAISLKQHDPAIDVVVHEKYKQIGYNHEGRRCGEAHNVEREWAHWKPEPASIFNEIHSGTVTIGTHDYHASQPPGRAYILNRQEFICQFHRQAQQLGATILTGDRVKSADDLDGDFIVDASGCPSTIKRDLGIPPKFYGTTYQQTIEHSNYYIPHMVRIVYTDMGYFWIFPRNPKKQEINLGVGVFGESSLNLKEILERFKAEHGITGTINYTVGGLVPLGLQYPLRHENILFVGDAGVGAFPFLGQGIYRALLSGDGAGACLARRQPNKYPLAMQRLFIKWDVIGLLFMKANMLLRKVRPSFYLDSMNFLAQRGGEELSLFH